MGPCFIAILQSLLKLKPIMEDSITINPEIDENLSSYKANILKLFKEETYEKITFSYKVTFQHLHLFHTSQFMIILPLH